MEERQFKKMMKQDKNHKHCWRCKKATKESCRYGNGCLVQHCACEMTQGKR